LKKITNIIIHCSDSLFGDAKLIDSWHKERGWKSIGYHFVILNGYRTKNNYNVKDDGLIEKGRFLNDDEWLQNNEIGSHCLGLNDTTIGICLIGIDQFTMSQWKALVNLCIDRIKKAKIQPEHIIGHYETISGKQQGKTCPNFDVNFLRHCVKCENYLAAIPSKII